MERKQEGYGQDKRRCGQARLDLSEVHLWEPGNPQLYDLELTLQKEGQCIDRISSYAGLRSITVEDNKILINGKPVFQRLVLIRILS